MSKLTLSVCVITYNQVNFIRQALDSVLAQQVNFDWELVIADDFSTDGTRKILLEYQKNYPGFIRLVLQKKNIGAERNWLDLMTYIESKYIARLDGDDYWTDPLKLQLQIDFLEKNPSYALSFHPTKVIFEESKEGQTIWPNVTDKNKLTLGELIKENFIPSNSVVYRRQSYTHFPLGVMPGDWFLNLYHAQFGKIAYIDRTMSVYRRHSGGMWWDSFKNQDVFWKKHGISVMNLYSELLKMYGNDPIYRQTISTGAGNTLDKLIEVDQKCDSGLLKKVLLGLPDIIEAWMVYQQRYGQDQLRQLSRAVEEKTQEIETLTVEMLDLRSTTFQLRDELHTLRNSRVLGKIIKLRDFIGTARKRIVDAPRWTLHRIRVLVAPYFPSKVRKLLKKVYKKAISQNRLRHINYNIVTNKPRGKGLPLVSVVIPYYNRASTIDETISSLQEQTFTNFEVLVVNDGSTDSMSIEKLKKLTKGNLKLQIIHQQNQGVAAARNTGIKQAKGKYVICLDSDDMLEPSFIEKSTLLLEANPDLSLATTYRTDFGVINEHFKSIAYEPLRLYVNNMVITAAEFKKEAWRVSGGYKSGIGYEDWEYWVNLSEHGFWGKLIPEALFKYRTSLQSRFVEDKGTHWSTLKAIRALHPKYKQKVSKLLAERRSTKSVVEPKSALVNMSSKRDYLVEDDGRRNILITIPWMTFGGAETLIYNYCREVKDQFNISFATGLPSEHEWEYKFREISPRIYHMANLFEDSKLYIEFISNYITTRQIDILHIIHNGFTFEMLPELKKRHPGLKVVVTLFNDRAEYFEQSLGFDQYINRFATDNKAVAEHYTRELGENRKTIVIPNGINCYNEFNPKLFNRYAERTTLGIRKDDLAVFFVGRLSEEKNPDVFLEVARRVIEMGMNNIKFFIIGDGNKRPVVEKIIKDIASPNVVYLGYQAEVAHYLSAADIFVLPSSIEGFPLSILEAMAMGVAVVASDVGAVADIIDSGSDGFVVPPASTRDISDCIVRLCEDRVLLADIKHNARIKVEAKYSNVILGENYRKMYTEVNS